MMERSQKGTSIVRYNAFQLPANQYASQKTMEYGMLGGVLGFCYGVGNHLISKPPPTAATTIVRIAIPVGVTALAGITYGAVLSGLGQFRDKDDATNHFLAGLCAGVIPGSKIRGYPVAGAFSTGLLFGLSACFMKLTYMRNGGKTNMDGCKKIPNRLQLFSYKNDVEARPEYAKYFK